MNPLFEMVDQSPWEQLRDELQTATKGKEFDRSAILHSLQDREPADIALALEEIDPNPSQCIFMLLNDDPAAQVLVLLDREPNPSWVHSIRRLPND